MEKAGQELTARRVKGSRGDVPGPRLFLPVPDRDVRGELARRIARRQGRLDLAWAAYQAARLRGDRDGPELYEYVRALRSIDRAQMALWALMGKGGTR